MNSLQMSPDISRCLQSTPDLISWPRLTAKLPLFLLLFASPAHVIDAHLPRIAQVAGVREILGWGIHHREIHHVFHGYV